MTMGSEEGQGDLRKLHYKKSKRKTLRECGAVQRHYYKMYPFKFKHKVGCRIENATDYIVSNNRFSEKLKINSRIV